MRRYSTVLVLLFFVLGVLPGGRPAAADDTEFDYDIIYDTPEKFKASGTLSTVDRSVPPDNFQAQIKALIDGDNWQFLFYNDNQSWRILPTAVDNGSRGTTVHLEGEHEDGPHAIDQDPNDLPETASKAADAAFSAKGPVSLTASRRVAHPAGSRPHWDVYSIRHNVTAMQGPDHLVTGPFEIKARHTAAEQESTISHELAHLVMGSSGASGGRVSYDAGTGLLTIYFGSFDILNSTGSITPGIEPAFLGDSILNTLIAGMILPFQGPTGDGGYRFGGGGTDLLDPAGQLQLGGRFMEYLIYDTSRPGPHDSFALFDTLTIVDAGPCASTFLDEFAAGNVMGETIPEEEWLEFQGICLTFVTEQNLATLTGNFTVSAFNVPATVVISAAKTVGDVSAVPQDALEAAPIRSHPNPFRNRTTIRYRVSGGTGPVRIDIFEPAGKLVRRLVDLAGQEAGDYAAEWDGTSDYGARVSSGIYLYRVTIGNRTFSSHLVLIR